MRQSLALLLAPGLLGLWQCPHNSPAGYVRGPAVAPDEYLSTVHVADPRAERQLMTGFHYLEQRVWRWTARRFSVVLNPPGKQGRRPIFLDLRFQIPAIVIDTVGQITLTATIEGAVVGSHLYTEASDSALFVTEVPEEVSRDRPLLVEFELDKAIPSGRLDSRELGIVVASVALK